MSTILLSELKSALPRDFVKDLMRAVDWAYDESHEAVNNNSLIGKPEAAYLRPHYRRCILEHKLKSLSKKYRLVAKIVDNDAGNYQFTEIYAGKLIFTLIHAGNSSDIVRKSNFRQRHAQMNSLLSQIDLFETPRNSVDMGTLINAVIYHGTDFRNPNKAGFIKIGFPAPCNTQWAWKLDCYDLLESYASALTNEQSDDDELIIKWKRKSGEAAS